MESGRKTLSKWIRILNNVHCTARYPHFYFSIALAAIYPTSYPGLVY